MPNQRRFSLLGLALILILGSGLIRILLKQWLSGLEQGGGLWRLGWLSVDLFRLVGLAGFGLLIYAAVRSLIRLFRWKRRTAG